MKILCLIMFIAVGSEAFKFRLRMSSFTSADSSRTKTIFDRISTSEKGAGGAGGSVSYKGLLGLDKVWSDLRNGQTSAPIIQIIENLPSNNYLSPTTSLQREIVVCGGTLGIFYAAAMQRKGFGVTVVERNKVAGRDQEWNISKKEMKALIQLQVLDESSLSSVTGIEFNPVRVGFTADTSPSSTDKGFEVYVRDILNLGVKPDKLIQLVKDNFIRDGGVVIEDALISKVQVFNDCAVVTYSQNQSMSTITTKLVMDAMGSNSPISKQLRNGAAPDGVCVVVGSCASGFPTANNTYSDLIYADNPILTQRETQQIQYFWEAFPAGSGPSDRTSYLFTYMDAQKERPSILEIMDDYWTLMPRYQGVDIGKLEFKRILYGLFPAYRNSPLQSPYDRLLPVGDASGVQSPLSFGGFGSLTRHIERIVHAVTEALQEDLLTAEDLRHINFYMPNLSAYWMFQRAMSVPLGKASPPKVVLGTLVNSFSAMEKLGDDVMRPFLQDVLQFIPLLRTLVLAGIQDPLTPFKIVPHVGAWELVTFTYHFMLVGVYTFSFHFFTAPVEKVVSQTWLSASLRFQLKRLLEAWKFGSGMDYYDHE